MSFHGLQLLPTLSDCALNASESRLPEAWDGLIGLWSPLVGHQGLSLAPLGVGQYASFSGLDTSDYVYNQPGLVLDFTSPATEYAETNLTMASLSQYSSLILWQRKAAGSGCYVASSNSMSGNVVQLASAHTNGAVYVNPTIDGFGSYSSNDAAWHTTASRFDGTQGTNATRMRAWHDGQEQTLAFSGTISASTSATPGTIRIGHRPDANLRSNGRIGFVAIWNRPLCPSFLSYVSLHFIDMLRRRPIIVSKAASTSGRLINGGLVNSGLVNAGLAG